MTEAETRANADCIAQHLKASGWQYVGNDPAAAGQNTGGTLHFLVFTQSPWLPPPADSVPVALAELGLAGGATVQDLWSGRTLGPVSGEFAPYVRRHGAGFHRLQAPRAAAPRRAGP